MGAEVVIGKRELRRPYNYDTLRDIVPDETPTLTKRINGDLIVGFAKLSAEQVDAIRLRLTTTCDADADQVVALTQAADTARAWEVPADLAPTPLGDVTATRSADLSMTEDAAVVAVGDGAAIADLAAQVEVLTKHLADLTAYVLTREP